LCAPHRIYSQIQFYRVTGRTFSASN